MTADGHEAGDDLDDPGGDCRRRALDLLARREHARLELEQKLGERGFPTATVADVLDALERDGLLDEQRFAEAFVRSRIGKGQGPVRIRAELGRRGVGAGERFVATDDERWRQLAREVRQRRFGAAPPVSAREKARQARFLEYRGFTAAQIRDALEFADDFD